MGSSGLLVPLLIVALVVAVLYVSLKKVPTGSNWTVERFGRFTRVLTPGLHVVVPVLDRVGARVDMRETTLEVPLQSATSKDKAAVAAGALLSYQVVDAARATYEVPALSTALVALAGTHIRSVIGARPLVHLSTERAAVNAAVMQAVASAAADWGVKVLRLELKDIVLPG